MIRTVIAAVGLNALLLLRGQRFPLDLRSWQPLIVIGLGNTLIPFLLITWGEKSVPSGIAAVLNATTTFFSLVIAHYVQMDERITIKKVAGLVVGFAGVLVLMSRSETESTVSDVALWGQVAIVAAALFYAVFTNYSKKVIRNQFDPMVVSAGAMSVTAVSAIILTFASPYFGGPEPVALGDLSSRVLGAALVLGFVNTLVAYMIYYWLVSDLGAARSSMVAYIIPPVGLFLGVLFLSEPLDIWLIVGAVLIFAGIGIVNLRFFRQRQSPPLVAAQPVDRG
jgi:drug/metabolite transporter (DMT)-like permease